MLTVHGERHTNKQKVQFNAIWKRVTGCRGEVEKYAIQRIKILIKFEIKKYSVVFSVYGHCQSVLKNALPLVIVRPYRIDNNRDTNRPSSCVFGNYSDAV